jgi:glucose/arabinose dehydrogenase
VRFLSVLACLALLAGCGKSDGTPDPGPTPTPGPTCGAGTPLEGTPPLTSQRVLAGLSAPLDLEAPRGDANRLFIVSQTGRILILRGGALVTTPFLDISDRISASGEQGLLGLAFHPRFLENGRFFVNYVDRSGDSHIAEFRASGDVADPGTERTLLRVDQPFSNHNGGGLEFGNDGLLYIALGDGGSAGDPQNNAQSLTTLLGKLLRIDVDAQQPYGIPGDNPFVATPGLRREIWAYGLRNPWRFAFDRATGDLFIGDVGQGEREEIDVGFETRGGGENYGWRVTEGTRCYNPAFNCGTAGITFPVVEYDHGVGCSVTGGVVYRGCRLPGYAGTYFYGDFCSGRIRSFRLASGQATDQREWTDSVGRGIDKISSFGVDNDGEIYILDYADGELYKIVPAT